MEPLEVEIRPARPDEREAIAGLLRRCDLVWEDVAAGRPLFWAAVTGGRITGCVGLEPCPPAVLLRSLAVDPDLRGRRAGTHLLMRALLEARRMGGREVYLLTTTAEGYFRRFGFRPVPRDHVPDGIGRTAEFRTLCPATAVAMRLDFGALPPSITLL